MMPLEAARCAWEVRAGMIPGQPDPTLTKRWGLTSAEWDQGKGLELFWERAAIAEAYARNLQMLCFMGRECNWTELTFIWF
jgi:hypothetical protein